MSIYLREVARQAILVFWVFRHLFGFVKIQAGCRLPLVIISSSYWSREEPATEKCLQATWPLTPSFILIKMFLLDSQNSKTPFTSMSRNSVTFQSASSDSDTAFRSGWHRVLKWRTEAHMRDCSTKKGKSFTTKQGLGHTDTVHILRNAKWQNPQLPCNSYVQYKSVM